MLHSITFNDEPAASSLALSHRSSPDSVSAVFALTKDGTIDTYRGPRTQALALTADFSSAIPGTSASVHVGPVPLALSSTP